MFKAHLLMFLMKDLIHFFKRFIANNYRCLFVIFIEMNHKQYVSVISVIDLNHLNFYNHIFLIIPYYIIIKIFTKINLF